MTPLQVDAVFVYGTLKRNQKRAGKWPCRPTQILEVFSCGRLYDLGPYPAMINGEDRVHGEIWFFEPQQMEVTLETLDEIEGYQQGSDDLYIRRVIECQTLQGETFAAFGYVFANPVVLRREQLVQPDTNGFVTWPAVCQPRS